MEPCLSRWSSAKLVQRRASALKWPSCSALEGELTPRDDGGRLLGTAVQVRGQR